MIIVIERPKLEPSALLVECGQKASRVTIVIDRPKFEPNAPLVESVDHRRDFSERTRQTPSDKLIKSTPNSGVAV